MALRPDLTIGLPFRFVALHPGIYSRPSPAVGGPIAWPPSELDRSTEYARMSGNEPQYSRRRTLITRTAYNPPL